MKRSEKIVCAFIYFLFFTLFVLSAHQGSKALQRVADIEDRMQIIESEFNETEGNSMDANEMKMMILAQLEDIHERLTKKGK